MNDSPVRASSSRRRRFSDTSSSSPAVSRRSILNSSPFLILGDAESMIEIGTLPPSIQDSDPSNNNKDENSSSSDDDEGYHSSSQEHPPHPIFSLQEETTDPFLPLQSSLLSMEPTSATLNYRRRSSRASSSSQQQQQQRPPLSATSSSSTHSTRDNNLHHNRGLRASLDSGMAAVRRWIRSHSSTQQQQQSPTTSQHRHPSLPDDDEEDYFRVAYHTTTTTTTPTTTIVEEDYRQRAQSEPDILSSHLRDAFFHHFHGSTPSPHRGGPRQRRRHGRTRAYTSEQDPNGANGGASSGGGGRLLLSSSAAAALVLSTPRRDSELNTSNNNSWGRGSTTQPNTVRTSIRDLSSSLEDTTSAAIEETDSVSHNTSSDDDDSTTTLVLDQDRQARIRWMQINRRFQVVITIVAILFSLLLFVILLCWVVLTSTYVVSFEKECDVPLQLYYWLVTVQLGLDIFRNDILRYVFRWDSNSSEGIPCRVVAYNIAYLIYAVLVLRLGILSVFVDQEATCRETAPKFFHATTAFVSLSLAAWALVVLGYVVPLCVVAGLLTYNGYNPSDSSSAAPGGRANHPVFPAAYALNAAPPGCVDRLPVVALSNFPDEFPKECCICMETFGSNDVVVKTACGHVFHKSCCREWLRRARTCPVCRHDIPSTMDDLADAGQHTGGPRFPVGPAGRPVASLLGMLQHHPREANAAEDVPRAPPSGGAVRTSSRATLTAMEEGLRRSTNVGSTTR